jgi:hypothetical protein
MAKKTHCDVCDAVGADDFKVKQVSVPGKPAWDRARLKVTVYINAADGQGYIDEPGAEAGRKDVCDDCRARLVAEAFGLRTADEVHRLRDEVTELTRQLALARAGETVPAPPFVGPARRLRARGVLARPRERPQDEP